MIKARPWIPGEKISQPGLYSGVPIRVYHGYRDADGNVVDLCNGPSVSSSGLRTIFSKSPRHYWSSSPYNPNCVPQKETAALILGRAAHHLFLGEAEFRKEFVIRPEEIDGDKWNGNRKSCKAWLAQQELAGLTVLTPEQVTAIQGMARALSEDPLMQSGILRGLIEHTIVYRDEETGVWVRVRPDAIPNDSGDFGDLKTTTDVTDDAIERTIGEYNYPMQGDLVAQACQRVLGITMQSFNLVFAETKEPHCVRTVSLWPQDLELAAKQNRAALRMFTYCLKAGKWPGPGGTLSDARYIAMKSWDRTKAENRIREIEQEIAA